MRPGSIVLPCGPNTVQFGLDRRWALRLSGLSSAEIAWLQDAARRHRPPGSLAKKHHIQSKRAREIILALKDAEILLPELQINNPEIEILEVPNAASIQAELPTLSALRPDGNGRKALANRNAYTVGITSSGRIGAQVALLLATAGVGRLILPDNYRIRNTDLGPYQLKHIGESRISVLRELICHIAPNVEVLADGEPDLVVGIDFGTQTGQYFGTLLSLAVPHLPIALCEASTEVGPFVIPNRSACTHCLHLTRTDYDENWPALMAQIAQSPALAPETVLASATASLAAGQVLSFIDGIRPALLNSVATISAPDVIPMLTRIEPHPECNCIG